ncbi:MAG: tyrosinase family protein [Actinomycetota bacterium]
MTVRKAVSAAAAANDIRVYAEGVRLMKQRSAQDQMDPLGWVYQSRMHGNPMAQPRRPGDPRDFSQCQHGSWFFLPWHRMYLLQFERIIKSLTGQPEFSLPYWDYPNATNLTIPPAFTRPISPLFNPTRTFGPISQPIASPTWQLSSTFAAFAGASRSRPVHRGENPGSIELNPHNPVHGRVGGDMGGFQSPLDSLFWIHHCTIDRIWELWLNMAGHTNPSLSSSWGRTVFEFPDPTERGGRRRIAVGDVATTAAAGYSYDSDRVRDDETAMMDGVAPRQRRDDKLELVGGTSSAGSVAGSQQVPLDPAAMSRRQQLDAASDEPSAPSPLFLRLENVGIEGGDASSMWNIYVSSGGSDRLLAGTIAPFGLFGLTRSGGRQTMTFEITGLSAQLLADESPVEVSFEPVSGNVEGHPFWERVALYTTPD